jgi:hypothetical protein
MADDNRYVAYNNEWRLIFNIVFFPLIYKEHKEIALCSFKIAY